MSVYNVTRILNVYKKHYHEGCVHLVNYKYVQKIDLNQQYNGCKMHFNLSCRTKMNPIYSFIRKFHFQLEATIKASTEKPHRNSMLMSVYKLLMVSIEVIPDEQMITKSYKALPFKTYKLGLRQWMYDWVMGCSDVSNEV